MIRAIIGNAPEDALSKTYMFVNGVEGDGVLWMPMLKYLLLPQIKMTTVL